MAIELRLGDVIFRNFEVPDKLKGLGGVQKIAVQRPVGPNKIVQALGPDPHDVSWEGRFTDIDAVDRARKVDYYRVNASQVDLAWGDYLASVLVKDFQYDPENEHEVPYTITLEIIQDKTSPLEPNKITSKESRVIEKLAQSEQAMANLQTNSSFANQTIK